MKLKNYLINSSADTTSLTEYLNTTCFLNECSGLPASAAVISFGDLDVFTLLERL